MLLLSKPSTMTRTPASHSCRQEVCEGFGTDALARLHHEAPRHWPAAHSKTAQCTSGVSPPTAPAAKTRPALPRTFESGLPLKRQRAEVKRLQPASSVAVENRVFRVLWSGPELSHLASFVSRGIAQVIQHLLHHLVSALSHHFDVCDGFHLTQKR